MQYEVAAIASLSFDPKNSRKHNKKNLDAIKASLTRFGQVKPIVVDGDNIVVAGNGTMAAAKDLGWTELKIVRTELKGAEALAFAIADNRTAELAEWDQEQLAQSLSKLIAETDINMGEFGFSEKEVDELLGDGSGSIVDYTKKIKAPVYEIRGERPSAESLVDTSKTKALMEKIQAANIPQEDKDLLFYAAGRHLVFNYEQIAEYYAHAPKEVQELMEDSALVIIDFKKAIEGGFVVMSKNLAETYEHDV